MPVDPLNLCLNILLVCLLFIVCVYSYCGGCGRPFCGDPHRECDCVCGGVYLRSQEKEEK